MPSFTTLYRAVVMVAAGVIVVKGWQHYGPTTEQVQSFGVRAMEFGQAAWNSWQSDDVARQKTDPRLTAALPANELRAPIIEPAPLFAPAIQDADSTTIQELPSAEPTGTPDALPALYSRLEELGASEINLNPWGASGQLYRFQCRAALNDAPSLSRHFEAVAAEPIDAVEQVVAKVESWRATRGEPSGVLR